MCYKHMRNASEMISGWGTSQLPLVTGGSHIAHETHRAEWLV